MNLLIIKLGATGDVVRTTPLLRLFKGNVTWVTDAKNALLLEGLGVNLRCLAWKDREAALDSRYDLAINLEDTVEVGQFLEKVRCKEKFGAYLRAENSLTYTKDSARWFDLSLISAFGKQKADELKLQNRHTYQELLFEGLGFAFKGEPYFLPEPIETGLSGDVAIAADSGPVWPMKKWAYYSELRRELEKEGLAVNVLPTRPSLVQHLADVRNHHCLVGGDSLPMHFALGTGTRCVSLFTCTSPWEIFDYNIQIKIISPLLELFFYQRKFESRATSAISLAQVKEAVLRQLRMETVKSSIPATTV